MLLSSLPGVAVTSVKIDGILHEFSTIEEMCIRDRVREKRPPEPYKGKGIKYADEVIRRKEGKTGGKGKK